jgi:hypothetical protein
MRNDDQKFYDDLMRRVLAGWGGDTIKPTSTRSHDGAVIYSVYTNGMIIISGTLFELQERARINERRKRI